MNGTTLESPPSRKGSLPFLEQTGEEKFNFLNLVKNVGSLGRYRHLIAYLVVSELRIRYRGSFFGFLWTLMNPLLLMTVMWFVFSRFGRLDEKNYALFLLSGLMVWIFVSQSIAHGLNAVVKNKGLFLKVYVPKLAFPLAKVCSNLVNLGFFLIAYMSIAAFTNVGWHWSNLLIIPALINVFLIALGTALIFCTLNVFFRDFTHLTDVLLRVLFYLTPVIYPPEIFGEQVAAILKLNPFSYPILLCRDVLYYQTYPSLSEWLLGFGVSSLFALVGIYVFLKFEKKFIYYA